MIYLPNGCQRSEIKVTPSNWDVEEASEKTIKSLIKKKWKIYYRYYDPAFKGTDKWGYMEQIRNMNDIKDLAQRQAMTRTLMADEKEKVDEQGYNPITGEYNAGDLPEEGGEKVEEITPSTPFIDALWKASKMLKCGQMIGDIKCIIRGMDEAAGKQFDKTYHRPYKALKVSQVTRKHIIYMFQQRKKDHPEFSSYRQNKYRTGLMMLYKVLVTVEAVDSNIIKDIAVNTDYAHAERELLTDAEQIIIDTNLKTMDYQFWRYMRIFHRSGSRSSEMAQLVRNGGKNTGRINLEKQEFTVLVRKGKKWVWQIRPIPDDVLHLWVEAWEETNPGEYLFGAGLKPGPKRMGIKAPSDKWKKLVKTRLGINKDFYGLKALNMDQIDEKKGIELAASAAGHTDTKMAKKHYLPGHAKRQREELKKITVPFAEKKIPT